MNDTPPPKTPDSAPKPVTIKKYANRRLYNTATSSYVTLDFLSDMVKNDEEFLVFDAKSGNDITRSVLAQIIFEEETKGVHLLPISFLRNLIRLYGDNLQSFVPTYLEMSMDIFAKNQETMQQFMSDPFQGKPNAKPFEDTVKQNMAMFEQGLKMFGLSNPNTVKSPWASMMQSPFAKTDTTADDSTQIAALQKEITALKKQLKNAK